jgi:POT family proton-dependent oligopeptide transporter
MRMADRQFFGHPRALGYLAFTEVWERTSLYGMQALLPLYMVRYLLEPERAAGVFGLNAFRAGLETVTGPLTSIAFTAQLFGLYVGLVCLATIGGGWIGDRLGRTPAMIAGGLLMALGHLAMASEPMFMVALGLLIAGSGLFKGNLVVQVGGLYDIDDSRRTRAFAVYNAAAQSGAILGPLICGTLGEVYGWHYGFTAAAAGMLLGLAIYVSGIKTLPQTAHVPPPVAGTGAANRRAIAALMVLFIPYVLMIASALQAYSIFLIWGTDAFDRQFGSFLMPMTWFLTFEGIGSTSAVILAIILWNRQAKRGREPSDYNKLLIGFALCATAFFALASAAALAGTAKLPIFVGLLFFVVLTPAYIFVDAPLKAIVTRTAPSHRATMMVGVMFTMYGIANVLAGTVGRFYEPLGATGFWFMNATTAATAVLFLLATRGWISRTLEPPTGDSPTPRTAAPTSLPAEAQS